MAAKNTAQPTEAVKQITYLAAAFKAPRISEAAARLADHARDAGWTYADYLAAVLEREVSARNASGAHQHLRHPTFFCELSRKFRDYIEPVSKRIVMPAAATSGVRQSRNGVFNAPRYVG